MEFKQIEKILNDALIKVFEHDIFLLKNNINEPSITHRLALYLENEFEEYSVDCEYNGYVEADNKRKYINIIQQRAEELGLLRDDELDRELINRAVFPDLIGHKRGENVAGSNLLIVEVKKSTNRVEDDYDQEKLRRYTSKDNENNLNYHYGVFVKFNIDQAKPDYSIKWYQDGESIE
jgi:hypothetical protein